MSLAFLDRDELASEEARRLLIAGVPEGQDARVLAELARVRPDGLIHVAIDDARASRLAEALAFFAPDLPLVYLPAWDCLPYDRVSPHAQIVSRRIDALSRLAARKAGAGAGPLLVLTTVNAISQRLAPPELFADAAISARIGQRVDLDALQGFLARNGYGRAQTVREPGEFALRGGIFDIFPPGLEEPIRLDFFGDELEQVRSFDPISQRTTGKRDGFDIRPMSELFLDEPSIARFRRGYRDLFGAVTQEDPLYEAVSAGRKHPGMEHWLPLFHSRTATLFEFLPGAALTLDHQAEEARTARAEQVREFYDARLTMREAEKRASNPPYKPLPPELLYLTEEEWRRLTAQRWVADLSPFAAPDGPAVMNTGAKRGRNFADARSDPDQSLFDVLRRHVAAIQAPARRVMIAGYTNGARERLLSLLRDHGFAELQRADRWAEVETAPPRAVSLVVLPLEQGFVADGLAVITEQDILGERLARSSSRRRRSDQFIAEVSSLSQNDLVVHQDHGIGRYEGLETLTVSGAAHECLRIIYADNDKLYVPVENIEILSRYGNEEGAVALDKLGGAGWQARKARIKRRLKDMADALLRIAAQRELRRTEALFPPEGTFQEFSARFPYPETDDQLKAIDDVVADLGSGRPMDRLVCGDVGFGKTEVAIRAAFVAAASGAQVAVVVPTTLLARQHFATFRARFQGLPYKVEQLSRLVTPKDAKAVRDGLTDGSIDIVVGTHALLSKSVAFKDLGLLIIDEEQHFGVKQKERLKELRADIHVLTLTATPIPRTLQMALSGVRELSLIATPPVDRLAVRTFVLPYDPVILREAIMREHFRGGQTYYVCPRIEDLDRVHERLRELVPEVKIAVAHGQMGSTGLEEVMTAFYDGKFDILLCTSIVESGLDVPTANTMIIHRSDMFGLAQLYQLRGRIGRSKTRGYAYLTYPPKTALSAVARQRLHVIETLDTLGAGFTLASHDMDIRGAGNLLGEEQSGHIREVGAELYQQMLQEAIAAARSGAKDMSAAEESWMPQINLGVSVLIPEAYVPDLQVRLDVYRRLAQMANRQEIEGFAAELIDRFGPLPPEVENLLALIALKRLCKQAGVERLEAGPRGAVIGFWRNSFARPDKLVGFIQKQGGSVKLRPDQKIVYTRAWDDPRRRLRGVESLMEELVSLAA